MKIPLKRRRFSRRTVVFAALALALLCVLFVLGRPLPFTEHDTYRAQLRQLRMDSTQLDQRILQYHLGLPNATDAAPEDFVRLRQQAQALRTTPSYLSSKEQQVVGASLNAYVKTLVEGEMLLSNLRGEAARQRERRERFEREVSALTGQLPAGAARERARALASAVRSNADKRDGPAMEQALTALTAMTAEFPGEESADARLEAEARALLTHARAREDMLLRMTKEYPLGPQAETVISSYLRLYEGAQLRSERFRVLLFIITLLLVAFVLEALWRLSRTGEALDALNAELERRVEERTQALSAANTELRESEARKAAILQSAPDGIITLDEKGLVLDFNPTAEQLFRLPRANALGRDFLTLSLSAAVKPEQRAQLTRALHADTPPGQATRLEVPALRTDGGTFPAELTLLRVRSEGPPRFTTYVRDITERQHVERLKNEFISTVSHELRTPLTSIRGSLGLLEGGVVGELEAPVLDMVRIARTNTERLIRLINDILDLEKMESGMLELKPQPVDSAELIETTFSGVQAMADAARVTLVARADDAGAVRADRDRLIQVLTNLVSNAIKFSPVDSQVEVRAARDARGQVRFSVVDQGPGIPLDKRARLFGKFQQLDSSDSRSKGGTGLGLAISQAIVEQHGGHIEVLGEPGEGTTFTFSLQAVRQGSGALSRMTDDSRHTLLVVTADAELSGLLRGLLSQEGYRVLRTPSLDEAARLIGEGEPDALLVDPRGMEGRDVDFVRRLREQPRGRELPVLMLAERAEGGIQPLLVDWMKKPLDEGRFLHTLRAIIRQPGQARVLLVDDDVTTRQVLRARLEGLGAICFEAEDGERAVALARVTPPDLIVLDVNLPRLDGFEVVDILRQGKGRGTPLIVFTGRDLSSADQHQLTLGNTRHLIKTRTSEDTLMTSVKELLNGLLAQRDHGRAPHKELS
ncbi:ATP-binding protein [Melittangium boletus]|uniref:histidine kinase n=1 Tax=Melittangium boletus DSM 14713 TaxID=1294270 RepID=A0A250I8E7_9BACT|nr:ATP-binding protein [Melittangium boletus]ATB27478.1 hybrid sensor histidine kinase/response regulator [Melittangium boletus DSM 14713]